MDLCRDRTGYRYIITRWRLYWRYGKLPDRKTCRGDGRPHIDRFGDQNLSQTSVLGLPYSFSITRPFAKIMASGRSMASKIGPSRSTHAARWARAKAGRIASEVESIQPTISFNPAFSAASAILIASVSPPALSSLIFTA